MKQSPTTMLIAIISMFSVALGHADLEVNSRWSENIQLWVALSMKIGNLLKRNLLESEK